MAKTLVNLPTLDWTFLEETLLLNPKLSSKEESALKDLYQKRSPLSDHLWLSSSGVSGKIKLIALSREALLASAQAVNQEIEATSTDRWLLALPTFHVGGLGIVARAHLTQSEVFVLPEWNAQEFLKICHEKKITLTSLVPFQVQELVSKELRPPPNLRFIFVGGGALAQDLKEKALGLGYPVFETYGMTETCSQIATEDSSRTGMLSLPLWTLKTDESNFLYVSGTALCSAILSEEQILHPKKDGYYKTQDRVNLHPTSAGRTQIIPLGRGSEFAKIKGENVSLIKIQTILDTLRLSFPEIRDAAVFFDRSLPEISIELLYVGGSPSSIPKFLQQLNQELLPFEKISNLRQVAEIPRTALGKITYPQY